MGSKANCHAVTPKLVFASETGAVSGADNIKHEVFTRGPVACGINANDALEDYTGGILSSDDQGGINHIVSIVGFGKEGTQEYWIVRNSWGSH